MSKRLSGLQKYSTGRTDRVRESVAKTIKELEAEIERNDGIYPFNGGRLSQAEFCRRAKISEITLLRPKHRATTKVTINKWLSRVSESLATGSKSVRKRITERADLWKERYDALATKMHLYELAQISNQKEITQLKDRVSELERENATLRQRVSSGKIVPIPRK